MRNQRLARLKMAVAVASLLLATHVSQVVAEPAPRIRPAARAAGAKRAAGMKKSDVPSSPGEASPVSSAREIGDRSPGPIHSDADSRTVDALAAAAQVDAIIAGELKKAGSAVAPRSSDEDFLRRVSFDLAGVSPSPQEATLFGLDPDSHKREAAIERLLAGDDYAKNWARYWYDVIKTRATETRLQFLFPSLTAFESWMRSQLAANRPWNEIVTALLTATGDSSVDGQTAFIIAQRAEPDEVAAETSRVFLGIQLQCANCHDHPTDSWKREQFHSLAAFFPRMQARPKGEQPQRSLELASLAAGAGRRGGRGPFGQIQQNPEQFIRRFDTNGDKMLSKEEAKRGPNGGRNLERLFEFGDTDHDGLLTAAELRKIPPPMMQPGLGSEEYHMPDLQHPQSAGTKVDPVFFLGEIKAGAGLGDLERRKHLAHYVTSPDNPWFAKALVNRLWGQLVGEGFYMPIDDIGPERTATYGAALEVLSAGFTASGYDVAWLLRAMANTETYQRQIRPRDPKQRAPFAAASPLRLRADQLYSALSRVLGIKEEDQTQPGPPAMGMYRRPSGRFLFDQLFGFDPSASPDEVNGTIPQALFMMNSGFVNVLVRAGGQTRLHQILEKYKNDEDALIELYLVVHARDPSPHEARICRDYVAGVNNRQEAFEDILWTLLNSTEFQTKR